MTVIQLFLAVDVHDIRYFKTLRPQPVDDLSYRNHAVLKLRNEPLARTLGLISLNHRNQLQGLRQLVVCNAVVQPAIRAIHDIVDVPACRLRRIQRQRVFLQLAPEVWRDPYGPHRLSCRNISSTDGLDNIAQQKRVIPDDPIYLGIGEFSCQFVEIVSFFERFRLIVFHTITPRKRTVSVFFNYFLVFRQLIFNICQFLLRPVFLHVDNFLNLFGRKNFRINGKVDDRFFPESKGNMVQCFLIQIALTDNSTIQFGDDTERLGDLLDRLPDGAVIGVGKS